MEERKEYGALDLIRIIASFFVVIVHVHFPRPYLHASMAVARFAVPVFFMISGYFLFSSSDSKETKLSRIRKTFRKITVLTLVSILLYTVSNSIVCLIKGQGIFNWFFSKMNTTVLLELLIYNRTEFLCSMIWYLPAFLYALVIIHLLVKYDKLKISYYLIPVLLILNIIMGEVLKLDWYYQGNWLFTALPFVLTGRVFREYPKTKARISTLTLWMLLIAGVIITINESFYFEGKLLYIGTIFTTVSLFMIGLGSERKWPSAITLIGRKITMYIFIIHCMIRDFIFAIYGLPQGTLAWLMPFIVFFLSAAAGFVIYKVSGLFKRSDLK